MGNSLDDILADYPHLIFPEEIIETNASCGIDNIIGALNVYNLVQLWLDNNRPIFYSQYNDNHVPGNSEVIRFMRETYVPGYGWTDIYQLTQLPLLTGRMLLFNSWEYYCADNGITSTDIYGALALVAELVASYRDAPYDTTCMQIPECELLRLGIARKTSDCGCACRNFIHDINNSRLEQHVFVIYDNNSSAIGDFSTRCTVFSNRENTENNTECMLEQQILNSSVIPFPTWVLDENVSEYVPLGDYYIWHINKPIYRTGSGDAVCEERLI